MKVNKIMFKFIILFIVIIHHVTGESDEDSSCDEICLPNCKGVACPLYICVGDLRTVYVGCNCCQTCVTALKKGEKCDCEVEPPRDGPNGPNGPRVTTDEPICAEGLRCNPKTQRCIRDDP